MLLIPVSAPHPPTQHPLEPPCLAQPRPEQPIPKPAPRRQRQDLRRQEEEHERREEGEREEVAGEAFEVREGRVERLEVGQVGEVGLRKCVEEGAAEDEHKVSVSTGTRELSRAGDEYGKPACCRWSGERKTHSRVGCNRGECGATPTNNCASEISPSGFDESPSAKRRARTGTQCVGTVGNISRVRPTTSSKS